MLWAGIKCELSLRSIGRAVLYSGGAMLHRWIQQRSCGNRPASGCCEEAYYKLERCGQVRQIHPNSSFNRSHKMKIRSSFTHPQVVPVYLFIFNIKDYFEQCW